MYCIFMTLFPYAAFHNPTVDLSVVKIAVENESKAYVGIINFLCQTYMFIWLPTCDVQYMIAQVTY
jgi:hypothetical protein